MVVAFCTVATITSWKPKLRNACSACWANCGSHFENASSSISCAKTGVLPGTFGAGQVEAQRPGEAERHQFLLLAAGVVAGIAVRADELLAADVPLGTVEGEPVAHVQRVARPRLVLRRGGCEPVAQPQDGAR